MPIVREADGLAMSSRNAYLDPDDRAIAAELSRAIGAAEVTFAAGESSSAAIAAVCRRHLHGFPDLAIDYVEVVDAGSMERIDRIDRPALLAIAVDLHGTRLIDNTILDPGPRVPDTRTSA